MNQSSHDAKEKLPWTEKYRPSSLDQLIGQEVVSHTFAKCLITQQLPHLLLSGPPGCGKTSSILVLAKQLFGQHYRKRVLELNASDDRGIDVIRHKVAKFAGYAAHANVILKGHSPRPQDQTLPPEEEAEEEEEVVIKLPPFKLVILDEADALTPDAQGALRRIMELYARSTRFCLLVNHPSRLIDALHSRCSHCRFTPLSSSVIRDRLDQISFQEKMGLSDRELDFLVSQVKGDLRKGITSLQSAQWLLTPGSSGESDRLAQLADCLGVVPPEVLTQIWQWTRESRDGDPLELTQDLLASAWPVDMLLEQLLESSLEELSSDHAAKFSQVLARVDARLKDNGTEFEQLSFLFSCLWRISRGLEFHFLRPFQ